MLVPDNTVTNVLNDITTALTILNATEPDIAAIVALLTGAQQSLASILADADATEQADQAKIQGELSGQ